MSFPLLYIHQSSFFPVNISIEQALQYGYDIFLITDLEYKDSRITVIDINEFSNSLKTFKNIYSHLSPNKESYEMFCFSRWLIASKFHEMIQFKPFCIIDSDSLIYENFVNLPKFIKGHSAFDTPFINFFQGQEALELIKDEIGRIFSSDSNLKEKAVIGADGMPFYTDMVLFPDLHYKYPNFFKSWKKEMDELGFDSNVNKAKNFRCFNKRKKELKFISKNNNKVSGKLISGELVDFSFLHFQGHSKPLMRFFLDRNIDTEKFWFPNPQTETIISAFNYYNLKHYE